MATLTISSKGQITLPVALRRALGLEAGDTVAISCVGDKAVLEKTRQGDIFKWGARQRRAGTSLPNKAQAEAQAARAARSHYEAKQRRSRP